MLLVFGSILKRIRLDYNQNPEQTGTVFVPAYESEIGGHGALQALAASRTCVRVALVGAAGDGYEAGYILPKLRSEGMSTSAVIRREHFATGVTIETYVAGVLKNTQTALGASEVINHDQIPDEILSPRTIVLCQNEIAPEQNSFLLARAKRMEATTIFYLGPRTTLTHADFANIDYLIASEKDAAGLKDHPIKNVIWLHDNFDASIKPAGAHERIKAPPLKAIDTSGCADAFCGTFAAAIYEKMPLEKAVRRACAAAALCATKKGAYSAMPFGAEIEAALKS
jgi:ribokinase